MSRSGESDEYEENFPNEWAFWDRRTRQVMAGKPMRKALTELREALLALPEKRIISNAFSTAGKPTLPPTRDDGRPNWAADDHNALLQGQGEGVCIVGAFVWHKRVKAGGDAHEVMRDLPLAPDFDGDSWITIEHGRDAGLTTTLAHILMQRNDDHFGSLTPEERYDAFLRWIDQQLAGAAA